MIVMINNMCKVNARINLLALQNCHQNLHHREQTHLVQVNILCKISQKDLEEEHTI